MKVDEVRSMLVSYGLSEAEAGAFYHLAKLGEATATEIAKEAALSRAEVYRAADGLEARGLLERTMDRPQRFIPLSIEQAVEVLVREKETRLATLKTQREALVSNWPKPRGPEGSDEERFQVQRGRAQIEGILQRMLARAERDVTFAGQHRTVHRLLGWGLGKALGDAVARGVTVRVLTQLTEDAIDGAGLPPGCDVRHSEVPTYAQFLIVDQKEITVYITVDPVVGSTGRPETVLWMNSPDFIMGQQALFDDLWMQSVDREARRAELTTGFRPNQLRVVRGRLPRIDEMRALLAQAEKRVLFSVPDIADELAQLRVTTALKRAAGKKVAVRVLSPQPFAELKGVAGAQQKKGLVDPRLGILVVDDREALVVAVDRKAAAAEERAVVTTVAPVIALLRERFEAAWG